jgi:hypothetical protein
MDETSGCRCLLYTRWMDDPTESNWSVRLRIHLRWMRSGMDVLVEMWLLSVLLMIAPLGWELLGEVR